MKNSILKYAPIITPALTITVILFAGYWIYKKLFNSIEPPIDEKDIDINQLTFQASQYKIFADAIQNHSQGYGTNEAGIFEIFRQMNNNSDILELTKAFGKRTYFDLSGFAYNASLSEILNYELNSSEMAELHAILQGKGITIRF